MALGRDVGCPESAPVALTLAALNAAFAVALYALHRIMRRTKEN